MDRNESADDFADCVVRRTEFDTVMKPGLVVATMVVPALIALVMVTVIMDANVGTVFTQDGVRAGPRAPTRASWRGWRTGCTLRAATR